ncbi:MAG: DUF4296 domain-containing protein [Chryseobacterium sp.]|nr:DUF4296 domain-containing protein [Chryseobacterium sp.]
MKAIILYIMMILCVLSCTEAIEKPKDLISEDKMSEIIADFAVNEQSYTIGGNIDSENATRFILKKYNIKGELFTESYKYYMTKPETIKDIFDKAQDIIQTKEQKTEEYISKKLKESGNVPAQAR